MIKRLARSIRNNLGAGLLVFVPLAFTAWLMAMMGRWVDSPVRRIFRAPAPGDTGLLTGMARILHGIFGSRVGALDQPGLGLLVLFAVIFLLGVFARTFVGRWTVKIGEAVVRYVPVVRTVYAGVKQLLEAILGGDKKDDRSVVLVEFPHKGVYGIGFATGTGCDEIRTKTGGEVVSVFYPTTPNPTSGFMLIVPRKDVIFLDMDVEDAAKMIISGGMAVPPGTTEAVPVSNKTAAAVLQEPASPPADGDAKDKDSPGAS